ncbi:armadillo-like helical domain-containing protein 2 [Saccoglossus kowalevskii]
MFRRVFESVGKTWEHFTHGGEAGSQPWDSELNKHKRDIMMHATALEDGYDNEVKIDAIQKIGYLACTGGPEAASLAGNYIASLLNNLSAKDTSTEIKVESVKAIGVICHQHKENQAKVERLGGITTLTHIILVPDVPRLACWVCYTLAVLSMENPELLRELGEIQDLHMGFKIISEFTWKGWHRNMAKVMIRLIGYEGGTGDSSPEL